MKKFRFFSLPACVLALLALGILVTGCASSPYQNYVRAAKKNDLQKMEEALEMATNANEYTLQWYMQGVLINLFPKNEAHAIPLLRFMLNKGADVNIPFKTTFKDGEYGGTETSPLNTILKYYKNWSDPTIAYEVVKLLLENGADPNERWSFLKYNSYGSSSLWGTPLAYAKEYKNDKLIALLIEYGANDVEPLSESSFRDYTDSSTIASAGTAGRTAPAASTTPATPAFKTGTYRSSNLGHEMVFVSAMGITQVDYRMNGSKMAQGTYTVNGTTVTITFTLFYGNAEVRNRLEGKRWVYSLINDSTLSGSGETWTRTGF